MAEEVAKFANEKVDIHPHVSCLSWLTYFSFK